MTDIYKYAAKNNLRFPSKKGDLTVENLFQLPLKSLSGCDLDTVARNISNELKGALEESFVEDTSSNPQKRALTVSLDIVKDVIATKQAENKAALAKADKVAEKKKILDILEAKKDEKLTQASIEELQQRLAALDV